MSRLDAAIEEYSGRQARVRHPEGTFDSAGRWYPSEKERCACCDRIRSPSRRWPLTLNKHCRSWQHLANLHRLGKRQLKALREYGIGEVDFTFWRDEVKYKKVVYSEGRYYSVYSSEEYEIGKRYIQKVREHHGGGYYVYDTVDAAKESLFPQEALNRDADAFAVVEVRVGGRKVSYPNGKQAYTGFRPLREVCVC